MIIRGAVLPSPRKYLEEKTYAESPSQVRVEARPGEELAARWRPLQESWSGLEFYKLLGKEAKFVVGIDEQGAVVFCLPSDGLDPLLDQQFQSWLRRHTLKPAEEGGVQWGQVTVRVQAANDAQSGPAEEPPPEGNTKEERDD